jgi:hypothetical protein
MELTSVIEDTLVEVLQEQPGNDAAASALLDAIAHGCPVERIEALLISNDERVVKVGAWIGSELGEMFRPLLHHTVNLLRHNASYVRFFAIDCVLTCATEDDALELASVVMLLRDPESSVRWKTLGFLTRAADFQLRGALNRLLGLDERLGEGLAWLMSQPGVSELLWKIHSDDAILRKFGVAAAVRSGTKDEMVLNAARDSADADIAGFAADGFAA